MLGGGVCVPTVCRSKAFEGGRVVPSPDATHAFDLLDSPSQPSPFRLPHLALPACLPPTHPSRFPPAIPHPMKGPKALKLQDVIARVKQGAETSSEAQIEAQLRALAEHAPEYVTVKAYGACGTPALWVDRGANANALMARLREVAGGRHAARGM